MSAEEMSMSKKLERLAELDAAVVEQGRRAAELAAALDVEVTNERGERELLCLVQTVGTQAVSDAAAACLNSGQHSFPLNIARRLRVQMRSPAGPATLAALLRGQIRTAIVMEERGRQAELDAAARRAARRAGGAS